MGKAEEYIQGICNTGDWLTPGEAGEAVRIAREEVIEKACDWFKKLDEQECSFDSIDTFIVHFREAMEKGE